MNKSAIERLVEWLEYDMRETRSKGGDYVNAKQILRNARALLAEEQSSPAITCRPGEWEEFKAWKSSGKPTTPAGLVEELRELGVFIDDDGNRNLDADEVEEILSRHATTEGEEGLRVNCHEFSAGSMCVVPKDKGGRGGEHNCDRKACTSPTPVKADGALVEELIEAGETIKGYASSYAMQTYDLQGTIRRAIEAWEDIVSRHSTDKGAL